MAIEVRPLTDPDVAFEINSAAWADEIPDIPFNSRKSYLAGVANPHPGQVAERYVGFLDGTPAGLLELRFPQLDNLETGDVEIWVHPERRRHGIGRALFDCAVSRTRELGRKRLFAEAGEHHTGSAFAAVMGGHAAQTETRSRFDATQADQPKLDELRADASAHAGGYEIRRWAGLPPADLIDGVAALDSTFIAEAPMGDLEMEAENVDADRIRGNEERDNVRGRVRFHTAAVHAASGRLVAWTVLSGSVDVRWHFWQNITLVAPDHRGHRLGMLVKLENLRYTREQWPDLRVIDTFNASENVHMLAINVAMGFRAVDNWVAWQFKV
jgi:GNAT superfamily N-acetyltransferase